MKERQQGLKRLIKDSGKRELREPCSNCKCRRYNKCGCVKKEKK